MERSATPSLGQPDGDLSAGSITAQQRPVAELLANARLIAAAPDLLESCLKLFCLAVMPSNYPEAARQEMLTKARAVIAKAKGEA